MSRTMNSQALVLLDRMLGLSGPGGEQYTTLDDGNVQQVLEISEVARRSLTPAGSGGVFTMRSRVQSTSNTGLLRNRIDPYNFTSQITGGLTTRVNGYPTPVPRGFDVWLIGASAWSATPVDRLDWIQLDLTMPSSMCALNQTTVDNGTPIQAANDIAFNPLVRWDTVLPNDFVPGVTGVQVWATENGTTYIPLGMRLRRGTFIDTLCEVGAANISGFTTLTIGLFPEGLGQDIAT